MYSDDTVADGHVAGFFSGRGRNEELFAIADGILRDVVRVSRFHEDRLGELIADIHMVAEDVRKFRKRLG